MKDFLECMDLFRRANIGRTIRGQVVDGVEVTIDDTTLDKSAWRFILVVHFRENPTTEESPEQNLLQRVFSEIPTYASVVTNDEREAEEWMRGTRPLPTWRLSDEVTNGGS